MTQNAATNTKLARAEEIKQRALKDPGAKLNLMKGSQLDRMAGLEPLNKLVAGKSILDIGSHRGIIDYELAKFGARTIHGFDLYAKGIEVSEELFADVETDAAFRVADISVGAKAFREEFKDLLLPQYDIVLMLAVFQHLRRQMSGPDLKELMTYLTGICGSYFVLRAPNFHQIDGFILEQGFEVIYYHNVDRDLAPVVIYERTS